MVSHVVDHIANKKGKRKNPTESEESINDVRMNIFRILID